MNKKLTLTIDNKMIKVAKEHAKAEGQSLSNMVENYFKLICVKKIAEEENELPAKLQDLRGIMKVGNDFDYKEILTEELEKKYGI